MPNRTSDASSNRKRGFILIVVIWGLGLLSVMAMTFVLNVRTQTRIASNLVSREQTEAYASSGVNLAILDLVKTARLLPEKRRFPHNSTPVTCRMGRDTALTVSVQDEEGKVDLNTAGEPLLRSLLQGLGVSSDLAAKYADAIIDFNDSDDLRRLNGAEQAEYEAAEKKSGPKNYLFQSVGELHQVLGLPEDLVLQLKPLTTVFSRRGGFDPEIAPAGIKKALSERNGLTRLYRITSNRRVFRIRAEAVRLDSSRFVREAVVELKPVAGAGHKILEWTMGKSSPDAGNVTEADVAGLRECAVE